MCRLQPGGLGRVLDGRGWPEKSPEIASETCKTIKIPEIFVSSPAPADLRSSGLTPVGAWLRLGGGDGHRNSVSGEGRGCESGSGEDGLQGTGEWIRGGDGASLLLPFPLFYEV